jgi:hypothetical protein
MKQLSIGDPDAKFPKQFVLMKKYDLLVIPSRLEQAIVDLFRTVSDIPDPGRMNQNRTFSIKVIEHLVY